MVRQCKNHEAGGEKEIPFSGILHFSVNTLHGKL
jgi:hypothetical protein